MNRRFFHVLMVLWCVTLAVRAQHYRLAGVAVDAASGTPVPFASVLLSESGLWAITGEQGTFVIRNVPAGRHTLTVQCLGYQKLVMPLTLNRDVDGMRLKLHQQNLKLDEVTVTARRKQDEATTSYTIDRQTLDQQQLLNISDVASLLPGGKTTDPSLLSDNRLALRSGSQEKGNASFGTAVEVDGVRLDNNAAGGETMGASTRTVSSSDVESIELVTGIPSVEYGDLSNGIVKVNTRRGKSPFVVEGKLNQHTRQVAVNKGFDLGARQGLLNVSFEHARSFGDAASPHTAYQRNILSLRYSNVFMTETTPLTLSLGLTGNLGGYNSETDPDEELENYNRVRDNALRAHLDLQWLVGKPWLTNLTLNTSLSYSDRKQEAYTHQSSASTQPYLHATEEGYYMAQPYTSSSSPQLPTSSSVPPIVLGPTGYWYVLGFNDSKPLTWSARLKAGQHSRWRSVASHLMAGIHYTGSRNEGRGTYYDDLSVAPTWREYRLDALPTMHNLALYAEEKVIVPTTRRASFELTAGLRDDITLVSGSDYGTVSSLSPRANARYVFWRAQRRRAVSSLEVHAGWGKSVKLPSFQVLYPSPTYSDLLVFASTSTADNTSYYAYHTQPTTARHNPALRWQYTLQTDLGLETTVRGTRISLSAFRHTTHRSYMATRQYTPFAYQYTSQSALQQSGIPAERRTFDIDPTTGVVTVGDATGALSPVTLATTERHTYTANTTYTNATPLTRYGVEWIVDFARIEALRTALRLDGSYYHYKGTDDVLFADVPLGVSNVTASGQPYQYVGYYRGSNVSSAGTSASASVSNGALSRQLNLNATLTTHLPRVRLVVALRLESTLYSYRRALCELSDAQRGYMLEAAGDYAGQPYDGSEDRFVVVYPDYYSTWEHPDERLPFAERFLWAKDNDPVLYSDLSQLVVRSNYAYTLNPNRLSAYYSANLSITKELGDHVSVSFYANNFWNTMRRVHSTQTDLYTSLFDSSYVPSYYYGLSLRLKL
ncbi:MAG: TonB-dependent receptor [Prevotella sp.]|nr:TonB-dependent receptor [Prevotella sp.]